MIRGTEAEIRYASSAQAFVFSNTNLDHSVDGGEVL